MANLSKNYAKVYAEGSLSYRLKEAAEKCLPIAESVLVEIDAAAKDEFSWDVFDLLHDASEEGFTNEQKNIKQWALATMAAKLLEPKIVNVFLRNKNNRVNERVEDDFWSKCRMEIFRVLPQYDHSVSQFPNFISPWLEQIGYVHEKDQSVYMEKRNGVRLFSINGLANSKDDGGEKGDPYFATAADYSLEEAVERRAAESDSAEFVRLATGGRANCCTKEDLCNTVAWAKILGGVKNFPRTAQATFFEKLGQIREEENYERYAEA